MSKHQSSSSNVMSDKEDVIVNIKAGLTNEEAKFNFGNAYYYQEPLNLE